MPTQTSAASRRDAAASGLLPHDLSQRRIDTVLPTRPGRLEVRQHVAIDAQAARYRRAVPARRIRFVIPAQAGPESET
jgi:hypothetical protein